MITTMSKIDVPGFGQGFFIMWPNKLWIGFLNSIFRPATNWTYLTVDAFKKREFSTAGTALLEHVSIINDRVDIKHVGILKQ